METIMFLTSYITGETPKVPYGISKIYYETRQAMSKMEQTDANSSLKNTDRMMKSFVGVIDCIGGELRQAKQKYQSVDKRKLIEDKRLEIAQKIQLFRDQCSELNKQISSVKQKTRLLKESSYALEIQNEGLERHLKTKAVSCNKYIVHVSNEVQPTPVKIKYPETSYDLSANLDSLQAPRHPHLRTANISERMKSRALKRVNVSAFQSTEA